MGISLRTINIYIARLSAQSCPRLIWSPHFEVRKDAVSRRRPRTARPGGDDLSRHRRQYEVSYSNDVLTLAAMVVQRRLAPGFRGRGGEVHRGRTCWRTRDFHRCLPDQGSRGQEEAGAWRSADCLAAGRGGIPCAPPIARK